ncbi:MAG: Nif3-like dinuclear metal center hexameric protein [Candidatus Omnitrophota bacterium]
MKLHELVRLIENAVPLEWALPDDPVGLQIGDPDREVHRVLAALEASTEIIRQAVRQKADLLLVHHPLIYSPLRKLLENHPIQRLARELVRQDMAFYAAHTNMDLHPEGMAKVWAEKLGCEQAHPLASKPQSGRLKLITFVPPDFTDRVRQALAEAGAGVIGEYDLCSFSLRGTGTFRGSDRSNPFIGRAGALEKAEEDRLEMILPNEKKHAVVNALFAAHPYEEPAYDLYPLEDFRDIGQAVWVAEFRKKLTWNAFMERVKKSLPHPPEFGGVRPDAKRKVGRIALSTGSGSSVLPIVKKLDVDAYLTGEMGYHYLWEANEERLNTVTVGHGVSESLFPETIIPLLQRFTDKITWIAS